MADGQSIVLDKVDFGGSLEARKRSGVIRFSWRYTQEGRTSRYPIGPYDSSAPPKSLEPTARGFSMKAAMLRAAKLAEENANTPGGLRVAEEGRARAAKAQEAAQDARQRYTLKALCAEYVAYLKAAGKTSWRDVENIVTNHVFGVDDEGRNLFPKLHDRPANEVQEEELVAVLRRVDELGHRTTARKLRAYLRAAYACARRARSDPTLPSAFIGFEVRANPVEGITPIRGQVDKNPLTPTQLRHYWKALQAEEGVIGAALRLQLLSGAQRVQQLARVTDADAAGDVLRLFDRKGKRSEAREHLLPITKPMRRELDQLPAKGFLLSTDGGTTPMHATSLSAWASEVGARAKVAEFQLKRVRSAVETLLASAGVSKDVRGQLQSHGIGGVQDTHYDAHEYLQEKRRALDTLYRLLEQEPAKNVTPIRRKRA